MLAIKVGSDKTDNLITGGDDPTPGVAEIKRGIGVLVGDGADELFLPGEKFQRVCLRRCGGGELFQDQGFHSPTVVGAGDRRGYIFT